MKSEMMKAVKEKFDFENVKMNKDSFKPVTYKCPWSGKMQKGIYVGSVSPMDIFGFTWKKAEEIKTEIENIMSRFSDEKSNGKIYFKITKKSKNYFRVAIQKFPSYTRDRNLDPDYMNVYIQIHEYKENI